MDLQTANQPAHVNEPPVKQRDSTKWIVIVLLLLASIGTGITYFIFTNPQIKQLFYIIPPASPSENTASENTASIRDSQTWQKYTNSKRGYSFVYTKTWTISESTSEADFVLKHVSTTDPGTIQGSFLPSNQHTKSYCEQNRNDTDHCTIYPITKNREMIIDRTTYVETGQIRMLIVDPTRGVIAINISDANFETTATFTTILSTITFTDEELATKLKFCPTSWSTDRKTVFINEIEFAAKDLDEQFISEYCTSFGDTTESN